MAFTTIANEGKNNEEDIKCFNMLEYHTMDGEKGTLSLKMLKVSFKLLEIRDKAQV